MGLPHGSRAGDLARAGPEEHQGQRGKLFATPADGGGAEPHARSATLGLALGHRGRHRPTPAVARRWECRRPSARAMPPSHLGDSAAAARRLRRCGGWLRTAEHRHSCRCLPTLRVGCLANLPDPWAAVAI
eukprot:SAG31_NODE_6657_length_1935_cov_1.657407_3_plen_131_part_00